MVTPPPAGSLQRCTQQTFITLSLLSSSLNSEILPNYTLGEPSPEETQWLKKAAHRYFLMAN